MTLPLPNLDDRTYADLLEEARSLIPSEYPTWTDHNPSDSGIILLELFAWLTEMMLYRVNQIPDRNIETFLKLLNGEAAAKSSDDLQTAIRETVLELRRRYRAVTTEDFEQLALHDWHHTPEAQTLGDAGQISRVRCLSQVNLATSDPTDHQFAPGHISLIVLPAANQPNPILTFNRLEDGAELPEVALDLASFSIAFWVKLNQSALNWGLVSAAQRTSNSQAASPRLGNWWFLTQGGDANRGVKFGIGKNIDQALSATWTDTEWHHIAGTSDGSTLSLYVDGVAVASQPLTPDQVLPEGLILCVTGSSFKAGSDRWDDLSGQNNHAVKAADIEMPVLFQVQNYNGKNFSVMRFSSQGGISFPDTLNVQKPCTVMIVDRYYGAVRGRTLQSRDRNWLLGKHGGNNACYMEGWVGNSFPATPNVFTLSTVTLEGNHPAWYVDGELKGSSDGVAAPGKLGLCRGGQYAEPSEADVAAVLIWNRVLTPEERQTAEAWLEKQYGIAVKTSSPVGLVSSLSPIRIAGAGADSGRQGRTQRQIAEVSIWNRSRQANEIQTELRQQLTGQEAGLLGYWPLTEGTGQTIFDRAPIRSTGTVNGAEWSLSPNPPCKRLLRPQRSLRTALWNFLDPRRLLTTQHHVVEPEYVPVAISATLRLQDGASAAGVRQDTIAKVYRFFDPLNGGADGQGYPFGRNVYLSEVYELFDEISGVDYVETLTLQTPTPQNQPDLSEIVLQDHQLVAILFDDRQLTLRESWE